MQNAIRTSRGLLFECPSPSVWFLVGAPVTVAYDGQQWKVSMTDREGYYREGAYGSREEAMTFLAKCFRTEMKL